MGDPCGGRPRDDVAAAESMRLLRLGRCVAAGLRRCPELERALAVEDDEDLLLRRVAVRRSALLVRRQRDPVQPGPARPGVPSRMLHHAAVVALELVEVHDRARARTRLGPLEVLLAVERMLALPGLGPRREEPVAAGLRQVAAAGPVPLAEREHLEAAVTGAEGMRLAPRRVHEAVAGTHLVGLAVLPREPRPGEDEEDLLVGAVDVRRRRDLAGAELDAVHADAARAGGAAEVAPGAAERRARRTPGLDLVPVRERHAGTIAYGDPGAGSEGGGRRGAATWSNASAQAAAAAVAAGSCSRRAQASASRTRACSSGSSNAGGASSRSSASIRSSRASTARASSMCRPYSAACVSWLAAPTRAPGPPSARGARRRARAAAGPARREGGGRRAAAA